MTQLV